MTGPLAHEPAADWLPMRTAKNLCVSAIWVALLIGAAKPSRAAEPGPRPDLVVGPESSGKKVTLQLGQTLVIELPGNPTTGYQWSITGIEGKAFRSLGEPQYRSSPAPSDQVGVGGTYTAVFRAVSAGTTEIQLDYRRSWEKKSDQVFKLRAVCAGRAAGDYKNAAFLCPDGKRIRARFLSGGNGMWLFLSGKKIKLKQALSASGARYTGRGIEFWNKGDDASIREGGKEYTCHFEAGPAPDSGR